MNKITNINFCTCDNQFLLSPGRVCEICMGTVPAKDFLAATDSTSVYGPDYFEELERLHAGFSGPDLAA